MTENSSTGTVRVTVKDIYTELQRQGRLLEKLSNSLPDAEAKLSDHEMRIRKLEMRVGLIFGAVGLLGGLLGVFSFSLN